MKTTIRLTETTINRFRMHKIHPRATDEETLVNILNILDLLEGKDKQSFSNTPNVSKPNSSFPSNFMIRKEPLNPELAEIAININGKKVK